MADRGDVLPQEAAPATSDESGNHDPLLARSQTRVGTTLRDKWHLDVLLGVGGMAAVYAATHRNGSRAAVKVLHPEMSTNQFVRERFLWEGYVANAVGHDGAVKILDDDTSEDGSLYLVTELLDGETLEERRMRLGGRLPQKDVLVVVDQLLDVLSAAHAKGIVHRDLKPENVFLTRMGQVKVLDFGIARLRELSSPKGLTQSGAMAGTPAYMAPEHARGLSDEVDEKSDLWSCGAVMFCLLSGRSVHEGRTMNEQLANAITRPARSLALVAPDVELGVVRVVDRSLQFSKDMRWPDAASMQLAVRAAYEELDGGPISAAPRLALDSSVPDRTMASTRAAGPRRTPTTTRPVASSSRPPPRIAGLIPHQLAAWLPALPPRTRRDTVTVAGAGVFCLALVGTCSVAATRHPTVRVGTVSGAVVAAESQALFAPGAPQELSAPAGPPLVAATDLPLVMSAPPAPPAPASKPARDSTQARRTTAPSASAAPKKPSCDPPFVIDEATGKKRWKMECL